MARIVMLQFFVAFSMAVIAALISGPAAGISALSGALCYAIPNALFALRLYIEARAGMKKSVGANPFTFFFGEFLKIVTTIALLSAVVWLYHDLHWFAFLAGFILVLKSYLILLFRT